MERFRHPASVICVSLLLGAGAAADQIVSGSINFPGATITKLEGGRLRFRDADDRAHEIWISDIDLIIVDKGGLFDDFNEAEHFLAGGEPDRAILRYKRTLRLSESFWSDLITVRLLVACDKAGRLDQATLNFVRVVRGKWAGPSAAVRLIPQNLPSRRTPKAMRAVEHLEGAIRTGPQGAQRIPLELFRFEILSHTGDGRAASAARDVATMEISPLLGCERAFGIQLAALEHIENDPLREAELASLNRAIRDCPEALLPSFLLLKGRALLRASSAKDDMVRATWPFMRVVAHMPDDPRAAEGLYEAALALERLGRNDKAVDLIEECLEHGQVRIDTRAKAEAALERLRATESTSG
ncbi:MAG: hypothetical protein JSU63_16065 [Phycisphaerales bacterium]|nr:MAG: hypothetical protein JSU63_16065 [Phycisphaerales bacterium]